MRQVARDLGVAPSLISYFFASWSELLAEAYRTLAQRFEAERREIGAGGRQRGPQRCGYGHADRDTVEGEGEVGEPPGRGRQRVEPLDLTPGCREQLSEPFHGRAIVADQPSSVEASRVRDPGPGR